MKINFRVENMTQRVLANYEQFLLLPQCFQKLTSAKASYVDCMRKRVELEKKDNQMLCSIVCLTSVYQCFDIVININLFFE